METLKEKLNNLEVKLIGNRITALGNAIMISSFTALPLYVSGDNTRNVLTSLATLIFGATLSLVTGFGIPTSRIYKRTAEHIKEHGSLDRRFLRGILDHRDSGLYPEKKYYHGYCEEQGAYLAARDYGQLDVFIKEKERYSDVILPNF